jgi:hypothetical protein
MTCLQTAALIAMLSSAGVRGEPMPQLSAPCRQAAAMWYKRYNGKQHCEPMCGQLPLLAPGEQTFKERLSPQCLPLFEAARAFGAPRTGLFPPGAQAAVCSSSRDSWTPTNPVVVHRTGSLPFILGSVPKVACTNLRKLLLVLVNYHPYKPAPLPGRRVPLDMSVRAPRRFAAAPAQVLACLRPARAQPQAPSCARRAAMRMAARTSTCGVAAHCL